VVHRQLDDHDVEHTLDVPDLRLRELLAWGLRRRRRFRVVGRSMLPTLREGEQVLVDPRAFRRRPPRSGELVVLRHPHRPDLKMVKRIDRVESSGGVTVVGDNPDASTDSRTLGIVAPQLLVGRVQCRLP
jgi:nickel-type superoxide dismutase maturation protease